MVKTVSRYYGIPFKGLKGFNQGDPLYPNIFNIVVDAVGRHWVMIIVEGAAAIKIFDCAVQQMANLLYACDVLLESTELYWLRWYFYEFTGIFEQVELKTSVKNMESMVYQPGNINIRHSDSAYTQLMIGKGNPYQECK